MGLATASSRTIAQSISKSAAVVGGFDAASSFRVPVSHLAGARAAGRATIRYVIPTALRPGLLPAHAVSADVRRLVADPGFGRINWKKGPDHLIRSVAKMLGR
jgi:hypothetical protein